MKKFDFPQLPLVSVTMALLTKSLAIMVYINAVQVLSMPYYTALSLIQSTIYLLDLSIYGTIIGYLSVLTLAITQRIRSHIDS